MSEIGQLVSGKKAAGVPCLSVSHDNNSLKVRLPNYRDPLTWPHFELRMEFLMQSSTRTIL